MITQVEVTVVVFDCVRNNEHMNTRELMVFIKEHLPDDIPDKMIGIALLNLYERTE